MNVVAKAALIAVSLLLTAGLGFAADVKTPPKGAGESVKADVGKGKAGEVKAPVKAKIVDINSATDAELKAIAGIGDAYAAKIIAGRPYANKTQLKSRNILPANVYEQVKDFIIAKQAKK